MIKIITSLSALYKYKLISYAPDLTYLEMPLGTNTINYSQDKYKITIQNIKTINIGTEDINGQKYYCPERLFVELDKYPLELTVKKEALKNLEKIVNPEKVKKIYQDLKRHRRGIDSKRIEEFLDKNLININEIIKNTKKEKRSEIIKEYIMTILSDPDMPFILIKGGSSIELLTQIHRATIDIDTHIGQKNLIENIINLLTDRTKKIYFKIKYKNMFINKFDDIKDQDKRIIKLSLFPISKGGVLKNEFIDIEIPISFNTFYSIEELERIRKEYKITKTKLKHLNNSSCYIFSREMLLAEKFQSLISKPENSTRPKDFIDLSLIWTNNHNFNKFRKWLFYKWENQRNKKTKDEALKVIKENKDKELIYIKNNFNDAIKMYGADITWKECFDIYQILIKESQK